MNAELGNRKWQCLEIKETGLVTQAHVMAWGGKLEALEMEDSRTWTGAGK